MLVSLRHPLFKKMLGLTRAPKYLRFVFSGSASSPNFDALDLLDDSPRDGETVIAARQRRKTVVHIDYTDRPAENRECWEYEPMDVPADVLRDTKKWQEWAAAQEKSK